MWPRGAASGLKGGEEERALLEAIASAPIGHDLVLEAAEIETDRAAQQDVDILERNGVHVRRKQASEGGQIGLCRARVPNPAQVSGEIEGRLHVHPQFSIRPRATVRSLAQL